MMSQEDRITALATRVGQEIKDIRTEIPNTNGLSFIQMTQAAYNSLGTKDPNTVYLIVG